MNQQCKLLYISRYDFDDPRGRQVAGCKIQYLDNMNVNESDRKGNAVLTCPAPLEIWTKIVDVPGTYDVTFTIKPDVRGRPVQAIADVKFIQK